MFFCLLIATGAEREQGAFRKGGRAKGFVQAHQSKHRLRVCNAYPHVESLDIYHGKTEKLTGDTPMPYKACRDFVSPLNAGDKLDFRAGDASAGTFSISDFPGNDAVLLLVIHRHDTLSTAVSFESHVYANLQNAQVAIIDTYKGAARSTPRIVDVDGASKKARSEELRYDSVVAVNPGIYEVILAGQDGETKAKRELVALNQESYVILRVGVEPQRGPSYPQELVVFPQSDGKAFRSGVTKASVSGAVFALVAVATSVGQW